MLFHDDGRAWFFHVIKDYCTVRCSSTIHNRNFHTDMRARSGNKPTEIQNLKFDPSFFSNSVGAELPTMDKESHQTPIESNRLDRI